MRRKRLSLWKVVEVIMPIMGDRRSDWQAEGGVLDSNRYMFENQVDCDVTFYVGKQRQKVKAHKYVLLGRSSTFYAMLCGPLQETEPIDVPDIEPGVFQKLLSFIYYEAFEPDALIVPLLYAAKKYAVHLLVKKCMMFLKCDIKFENVFEIYQQAQAFDETDISSCCLKFIMDNGHKVLKQLSFKELSSGCVELIIKQEGLCAKEEEIYEAVKDWAKHECGRKDLEPSASNMREVLGGLRNHIRYAVMDKKYFADRVVVEDILTTDEKLTLCRSFLGSDNLGTTCFIQTPRKSNFQKKRTVIRFSRLSFPCCTASNTHAIELKCSRSVLLTGIVIYGATSPLDTPCRGSNSPSFSSNVRIELLEKSGRSVYSMTSCILISDKRLQEILFDEPVVLKPTWYAVILHIENNGTTFCGEKGKRIVKIDDSVFVEFRDCLLSSDSTTVLKGQIPGLLFCI